MTTSERTLLLMRHAKADSPEGVQDHERPLAARGRRDAPGVGEWLAEQGLVPDHVLCSDALRARETAELALAELPAGITVDYLPELYETRVEQLLDVISGMSDDVGTLLVVGHDPTMSETVAALTDTGVSLPTAAVAVISLPEAWADIAGGTGSLVRVRSPKD